MRHDPAWDIAAARQDLDAIVRSALRAMATIPIRLPALGHMSSARASASGGNASTGAWKST